MFSHVFFAVAPRGPTENTQTILVRLFLGEIWLDATVQDCIAWGVPPDAVAGVCGTMSGCDSGTDVSQTTASPEAKKADAKIQDGMKEFMQGKPKTKPQR